MTPGANVSAVARAHAVSPQQLFAWRRKAIRSGAIAILPARSEVRTQSFAPVEVTAGDGGRVGRTAQHKWGKRNDVMFP